MELKLNTSEAVRELKESGTTRFNVEGFSDEAVVNIEKTEEELKGVIYLNLDANTKDLDESILAGEENAVGMAAQGVVKILEEGWGKSPDLEASQNLFSEGREAEYLFRYQL